MLIVPAPFQFLDPGLLIDRELELVAPQQKYIDELLAVCRHPMTLREAPSQSRVTRQSLLDFLSAAPAGHFRGDAKHAYTPSYHFWMRLNDDASVRIAGSIALRIGDTSDIVQYIGHVGYNVYPPARGHHLAERACRLILPLARRHGMKTMWITCNPDNIPSRRTCERLGAVLVEIVPVPRNHELYPRGDHEKCRYRLDL